jgi:tetratricopeptide (TPR) repeat protein
MNSRVLQARMLIERGRYLEAEALLREALVEGIQSASVHAMLGLCLHHAGLRDAAKDELKAALNIDPNYAYAHYVLSFLPPPPGQKQTLFLVRDCIKHVQRALELEPNNVAYLSRLAQLRQQSRQWKQSLAPIDAALRLSPRDVNLAVQRAEALIHLGRREEARETLERALALDPEASAVHAGIGWALLRTGERQRAAEFFNEALRLHPDLEWAQHGALACAKHQYRIYRVLAYPSQRLIHRPWLLYGLECGATLLAGTSRSSPRRRLVGGGPPGAVVADTFFASIRQRTVFFVAGQKSSFRSAEHDWANHKRECRKMGVRNHHRLRDNLVRRAS